MHQTLLLADDSVTIQRVIELTFADEDIKVVAVSDGDQAIARINSDPPDIVLVDVGMPGRSGYEVAHHIKTSPGLKHIPVLLLTGAFEPVDQAKATEVGCDGVLAKPFEPALVIARVKELLGHGARPAAATADSWVPPAVQPPAEPAGPEKVARLDSYFDQLDAAFLTLSDKPSGERGKNPDAASARIPDIIDWFGAPPSALRSDQVPDLPLSSSAPEPPPPPAPTPAILEMATAAPIHTPAPVQSVQPVQPMQSVHSAQPAQPVQPVQPVQVVQPVHQIRPSAPPALPPLADAFAAILAAEQHEPMSPAAPAWPTPPGSNGGNGGGALTEDAIEAIAQRVLDRLSDQVIRNTVADVVSGIAERLVLEEIARIKSAIKYSVVRSPDVVVPLPDPRQTRA